MCQPQFHLLYSGFCHALPCLVLPAACLPLCLMNELGFQFYYIYVSALIHYISGLAFQKEHDLFLFSYHCSCSFSSISYTALLPAALPLSYYNIKTMDFICSIHLWYNLNWLLSWIVAILGKWNGVYIMPKNWIYHSPAICYEGGSHYVSSGCQHLST